MNQPSRHVNEKEIRPFVIEELRDYRVLKVKFKNIQERTEFGAELMFPELRKSTQDEIRYKQLKRAFEEALDEDEQRVLEAKYMSGKELNDEYIYTMLGMKKGKFYRKKKSAILSLAKSLGMV
ncbi:ArpU family phage packaging/lysis transcriptional regulator [Bacillus cereus group sp. TH160LC]|uniref:ArpU family phage packaging/lysis transcriptional regulator n=1 Tax=Bacillus cereus group sp. TH160LC TaxID=3018058 RepID=UPI0022E5CD7B|nr:ArpU family phage packaging/lysis transcriptional regulator [Bacillus cereus group sp. TH160LC]MDA1650989.1 ArpU family transcriptional regulator [Bacillus cereus group sp. TH160LC]